MPSTNLSFQVAGLQEHATTPSLRETQILEYLSRREGSLLETVEESVLLGHKPMKVRLPLLFLCLCRLLMFLLLMNKAPTYRSGLQDDMLEEFHLLNIRFCLRTPIPCSSLWTRRLLLTLKNCALEQSVRLLFRGDRSNKLHSQSLCERSFSHCRLSQ